MADENGLPDGVADKLKAQFPGIDLQLIEVGGVAAVFQPPSFAAWRRFQMESSSDNRQTRLIAGENLVTSCLVYPPVPEFDQLKAKRPGLPTSFAGELLEVAGLTKDTKKKSL